MKTAVKSCKDSSYVKSASPKMCSLLLPSYCWGAHRRGQRRVPFPLPILLPLSSVRNIQPLPEDSACMERCCAHSGPALRPSVASPQCPPSPLWTTAWPWPSWSAGDLPELSRGGLAPAGAKGSSFCFLLQLNHLGWAGG